MLDSHETVRQVRETDKCSDRQVPNVVCTKRNLELSERLSRLLNSSPELLQTNTQTGQYFKKI